MRVGLSQYSHKTYSFEIEELKMPRYVLWIQQETKAIIITAADNLDE